jgi:hypothetical protein
MLKTGFHLVLTVIVSQVFAGAALALRNFDAAQPIVVDTMRFFDANGNVLFDTAGGALPPAENGVLGPANSSLDVVTVKGIEP